MKTRNVKTITSAFAFAMLVATGASAAPSLPGAKALESRLYAPCCYGGTLDTHESDLAHDLRKEIESRVEHGEALDAIQNDFVARYGEKVLAARSDTPIRAMGMAVVAVLVIAGAGLTIALRRWTKREPSAVTKRDAGATPDAGHLDARIDAELAELDT
ncbi:cytochrome c-type biogenesis protein [Labilithrix luteola]|uniref:cytochrome c-type biogenesis protein n=1 Tax=Labilithrix luteola TaxID=1391654 RepID=UPI001F0B2FC9|nr:cytochrome c-type biogenesis protein CcmH [Labilithrix luteola]